jgi:hypothetical protein
LSLGEFFIALALYQSNIFGIFVVYVLPLCYKWMNFVTLPKNGREIWKRFATVFVPHEATTPHVLPCLLIAKGCIWSVVVGEGKPQGFLFAWTHSILLGC